MQRIIEQIEKAKQRFDRWDWTEDFKGADGKTYYASSRIEAEALKDQAARTEAVCYCEDVENAVSNAARHADKAVALIRSGKLEDALAELNIARSEELFFGAAPAYGDLPDAIESAIFDAKKIAETIAAAFSKQDDDGQGSFYDTEQRLVRYHYGQGHGHAVLTVVDPFAAGKSIREGIVFGSNIDGCEYHV